MDLDETHIPGRTREKTQLAGKFVLLIAPRFFGYEEDIAAELRRRGAFIDVLHDRPFSTPVMKAVTRTAPKLVMKMVDRLYLKTLSDVNPGYYNIILVVNGQTLSGVMLQRLRAMFPSAQYILYMWDSFRNRRSAIENLRYFDTLFSFDPDCAREYGMKWRPMFFSRERPNKSNARAKFDLSFIGTAHTDRFAVVSALTKYLGKEITFYRYMYLQAPWVYYAYRVTNPAFVGASIDGFHFIPLSRAEMVSVLFDSEAILEIEHPMQNGLTVRAFEAMGASRKLVTTNAHIRNYDFYNPNNICVIDRRNPVIPRSFFGTEYQSIHPNVYRKYSIVAWMDDILGYSDLDFKQPPSDVSD